MISAIVMASGFSRRFGRDKLKAKVNGYTLIETTVCKLKNSNVDDIVVVYRDDEIYNLIKDYGIRPIKNYRADIGQSESIRLGIESISTDTIGYMFVVADQPSMKINTINDLIDKFKSDKSKIVLPRARGKSGNPVIFPSSLKNQLIGLEGDSGGKEVIKNNENIVDFLEVSEEELRDIDTEEDLRLFIGGE